MTEKIEYRLIKGGYMRMSSGEDFEAYHVYCEFMERLVNTVVVVDANRYRPEVMEMFKEKVSNNLAASGRNSHFMLILCVDVNSKDYIEQYTVAKQACEDNHFAWVYEESEDRLIVFENQAEEFYGLRRILESEISFDEVAGSGSEASSVKGEQVPFKKRAALAFAKLPKATAAIVLLNILVFLVCTFTGDLLYNIGGVGLSLVGTPDQWYRVVSSMFLHSGISHLFNNMLLLWFAGDITERAMGPLRYTLMYFFSGICGCFLTFISEIVTGKSVVMIGASGAVFGVLGSLLALVIFKQVKGDTMKVPRIAIVLALSIYSGFRETNVANWAHIGGLFAGFLAGIVICMFKRNRA